MTSPEHGVNDAFNDALDDARATLARLETAARAVLAAYDRVESYEEWVFIDQPIAALREALGDTP